VLVLAGVRGVHRGFTHSLLSAGLVALVALLVLGSARARESALLGGAWLSHALLDAITSTAGGGVKLLWPYQRRYKLGLVSFSEFAAGHPALMVLESAALELLVFGSLLLAAVLLRPRGVARTSADHGAANDHVPR
jgi:membrane-bound metal-dependent hydrolase YbcI (DUF457 family)